MSLGVIDTCQSLCGDWWLGAVGCGSVGFGEFSTGGVLTGGGGGGGGLRRH